MFDTGRVVKLDLLSYSMIKSWKSINNGIDIALSKPLPNSAGLYSTNCQRSMTLPTGPWMAERQWPCNRWGRVTRSQPHLILSLLYVYPWLLPCLPRSPRLDHPFLPPPRVGLRRQWRGYILTFPRAHPCRAESARSGLAEATNVLSLTPPLVKKDLSICG